MVYILFYGRVIAHSEDTHALYIQVPKCGCTLGLCPLLITVNQSFNPFNPSGTPRSRSYPFLVVNNPYTGCPLFHLLWVFPFITQCLELGGPPAWQVCPGAQGESGVRLTVWLQIPGSGLQLPALNGVYSLPSAGLSPV